MLSISFNHWHSRKRAQSLLVSFTHSHPLSHIDILFPKDLETQVKRSAPNHGRTGSGSKHPFDDDCRLSASSAPSGKAFLFNRLHQSIQSQQTTVDSAPPTPELGVSSSVGGGGGVKEQGNRNAGMRSVNAELTGRRNTTSNRISSSKTGGGFGGSGGYVGGGRGPRSGFGGGEGGGGGSGGGRYSGLGASPTKRYERPKDYLTPNRTTDYLTPSSSQSSLFHMSDLTSASSSRRIDSRRLQLNFSQHSKSSRNQFGPRVMSYFIGSFADK